MFNWEIQTTLLTGCQSFTFDNCRAVLGLVCGGDGWNGLTMVAYETSKTENEKQGFTCSERMN